jgi:hypothetical protein
MENVKALDELTFTFHTILRILTSYDGSNAGEVPQNIQERVLRFKESVCPHLTRKYTEFICSPLVPSST